MEFHCVHFKSDPVRSRDFSSDVTVITTRFTAHIAKDFSHDKTQHVTWLFSSINVSKTSYQTSSLLSTSW